MRPLIHICIALSLVSVVAFSGCDEETGPTTQDTVDTAGPSDVSDSGPVDAIISCEPEAGLAVYRNRIEPLIDERRPSSCTQCHLAGTSLHRFIVPGDPCASMQCLVEEKLVDLDFPEDSLILNWIDRANEVSVNPVFIDRVIKPEYDGMLEWIRFSASCGTQTCESIEDPCGRASGNDCDGGICDEEDVPPPPELTTDNYSCDREGLALALLDHPLQWHGRCAHCHVPDAALSDVGDPTIWLGPERDWDGALFTYDNWVDRGFLNPEDPPQSLILLKPLSLELGGLEHGGATKIFSLEDPMYVSLLAWIEFYAGCQEVPE